MGKKDNKQKRKDKVILPPDLPPDIPDDEVEVSQEDVDFVNKNRDYAGFVSSLDTHSITKHVTRVANVKEDDLEARYEKRMRKRALEKGKEEEEDKGPQVDPVDALPVKALDGTLYYRKAPKRDKGVAEKKDESEEGEEEGDDVGVMKLTKAERRAKMKKKKKEDKKQEDRKNENENELSEIEDEQEQNPQAEVLAEVKKDLSTEERAENKRRRIAELGTLLLNDPESNIKYLKEMLNFCEDKDKVMAKAALLSCLVVFRDIIPGYRIRLPTEKELQMKISMVVKKMRFFESTLLNSYKAYIKRLITLLRHPEFRRVVVRCLCNLLEAHPHFNFCENILPPVVENLNSSDDVVRKLCSSTIQSLFTNEGKHGGEATLQAVHLIADIVKCYDCELHPDSIEVFLALSFDEDLRKPEKVDNDDQSKSKKYKKRKNSAEQMQPALSDKKRSKQELLSKAREEVKADFKAASLTQDVTEQRRMQSAILAAVFQTYFRVLKHAIQPPVSWSKVNGVALGPHPLLSPCLKGVGVFSHLIDIDFMADLMKHLKILASGGENSVDSDAHLTVSERMECCIVAFKVMRKNLDALNVDLQDFFVEFYNLIIEYRPERDRGELFAEALKIMLCDGRQHDTQRAAAFIKRLSTSALMFGSAESMAALVTVKNLLQKNVKCRYMLENDEGGGSLSGSVAKYQPYSVDPQLSGALASVLWELNLLAKHYHPAITNMASSISKISTAPNQVYLSTVSPQEAFKDLALESESFCIGDIKKLSHKRKRATSSLSGDSADSFPEIDEDSLKKKLSEHFTVVSSIVENEKLRRELDRTTRSLQLFEEYKKHRKPRQEGSKSKLRKTLVKG